MKFALSLLATLLFTSAVWADGNDTYNFRFSPIGLLAGAASVNFDIRIDPNWTLGPELEYMHYKVSADSSVFSEDYEITATGIGARANWFKNGAYTDGLYVGPSVQYYSVGLTTSDLANNSVTAQVSGLAVSCLVGYGWFWDSFNMMLGGGATLGLGSTSVTVNTSSGSTTVPTTIAGLALEYSLGWTF